MNNDMEVVFRAMCFDDTRDYDRMIRLFVRGLRGEFANTDPATAYTGSYGMCPLCSAPLLGILLAEHIRNECMRQRQLTEIVVVVTGNGEPEPHWEKD